MTINHLIKKCYAPYTEWPYLEEKFLRLPQKYSFNLQELNQYLFPIMNKVGLKPLNPQDDRSSYANGYFGMGFTYRPGAKDPHHDAFKVFNDQGIFDGSATCKRTMKAVLDSQHIHRFEKNFTEATEYLDGPLKELLSRFNSLITKVRIMELKPGEEVHNHFDYPYYENVRLHAILQTNDHVEWWLDGEKFTIPADGNLYWFDTGRLHRIVNNGDCSRIILSIHLSVYKDANGNLVHFSNESLIDLIQKEKI